MTPPQALQLPFDEPPAPPAPLSLHAIEQLAQDSLRRHGLVELGWRFGWDRALLRAGCCHITDRRITLSRPIFEIDENRPAAHDTILHEVAHALAGPSAHHGAEWRRIARRIGARPERCHQLQVPPLGVEGRCECGTVHQRARLPRGRYLCLRCGGPIAWRRRA